MCSLQQHDDALLSMMPLPPVHHCSKRCCVWYDVQVVGTALEGNLVRTVQMTRGPGDDHNLVTGNIQDSARSLQTGA